MRDDIAPVGMVFLESYDFCAYFFTHSIPCGTTFSVPVEMFQDLIEEPLPTENNMGGLTCEKHCLTLEDLKECQQECCNAPYRRFLLKIIG